jgi:hypothetical protein
MARKQRRRERANALETQRAHGSQRRLASFTPSLEACRRGRAAAAAGMVVDVPCDYLWCNCLVRLPSEVDVDRISNLEALKNGGNDLDALRD